jgi:hypothetical protein
MNSETTEYVYEDLIIETGGNVGGYYQMFSMLVFVQFTFCVLHSQFETRKNNSVYTSRMFNKEQKISTSAQN